MAPKINLIVAACENMGIGLNGGLPWRLKSEMAFFKRMTLKTRQEGKKNMVIMGRRTWESIPQKHRPLPGRLNVILSSQGKSNDIPDDVQVYSSFEAVVKALNQEPLLEKIETVWVIGGSSVYRIALKSEFCHRVYLTKINSTYDCDTFLDPMQLEGFKAVQDSDVPQEIQEENGTTYYYLIYEKVTKN